MKSDYPRDLIGYGRNIPSVKWPNKAQIAVQFVLNYEEGGENCILHGDQSSEAFLSDIVGADSWQGQRHMNMESMYEYGSRAGFWRLHRFFSTRNIPITVFAVATALEKNPDAVAAMKEAEWEIASHGLRWIDYHDIDVDTEREHIQKALAIHKEITGADTNGWYAGRTSENSRALLLEQYEDILYDSDSYADDLPYWVEGPKNKSHLIIPYSLETNDMRFVTAQGFNAGDQFLSYLQDAFDILYEEGKTFPKMMSIGLHCRIIGRPGRFAALKKFVDYIQSKPNVWICKREEIARHWHKHHSQSM